MGVWIQSVLVRHKIEKKISIAILDMSYLLFKDKAKLVDFERIFFTWNFFFQLFIIYKIKKRFFILFLLIFKERIIK